MGDCESMIPELKADEHLIAAAKHIFKALGSNNLTVDARKILAELGTQLSTMTAETKDDGISEIKDRLHAVEKKIMRWEEDQSTIWDSGPEEASEYLSAAGEAQKLTGRLESLCLNKDDDEYMLLQRAHNILKKAMKRLGVEFRHMLVGNRQPIEREHMSFRWSEEYVTDEISIISFGDESVDSLQRERDCLRRASEESMIDLIHPHVIPDLRCIANLMFKSNYDQECYQAYTSVRKDALDECLFILEMGKLSIEDVLRMECG